MLVTVVDWAALAPPANAVELGLQCSRTVQREFYHGNKQDFIEINREFAHIKGPQTQL